MNHHAIVGIYSPLEGDVEELLYLQMYSIFPELADPVNSMATFYSFLVFPGKKKVIVNVAISNNHQTEHTPAHV